MHNIDFPLRGSRRSGPLLGLVALAGSTVLTTALTLAAIAPAQAAEMHPQTAGPFTYVCGGIAEDEQQTLRAEARNYDMGLLFTQGARGEYLADVMVKLSRNGKEVASFNADGPRCLLKGPRGSYQVTAVYNDVTKRATLAPGQKNVQMRW